MDETEAKSYLPKVVHVDRANRMVSLDHDPAGAPPGAMTLRRGDEPRSPNLSA
jgi:aspartate 1-decarboxylase